MSKDSISLPAELATAWDEITRGIEELIPEDQFKKKLLESHENKKPLRVKAGFDPTAPDLHLGHTVLLQKLKTFQNLGHEVIFLIGDYTAMIGDPTGKSETRNALSSEQVMQNALTYQEQVFKILDRSKTTVVFNSEWLKQLDLKDILKLTAQYTVARLLERDDFSKRYKAGNPISLVEFMYPLMQGYDSVALKADIELGGTDQKFNLLVGRDLQTAYGQAPQCILTLPLLVGLDGEKKMSKSLNNYVGIYEPASEIYGKLMSISDDLMFQYYELLSDRSVSQIEQLKTEINEGKIHPKQAKSDFAREICERFHSATDVEAAITDWQKVHNPANRGLPEDIPEYRVPEQELAEGNIGLLNALRLAGMTPSNAEARRLVQSGGVHLIIDEQGETSVFNDPKTTLGTGEHLIRVGKRKFVKIIIS